MEKSSANIEVVEGGDDDVLQTTVSFNDQHNSVANKSRHKKLMLVTSSLLVATVVAIATSLAIGYSKGGINSSSSDGSISAATSEDTESIVGVPTSFKFKIKKLPHGEKQMFVLVMVSI